MLKILVGVGLGFLLFTNPEARQIAADLLRSTANAIAPEQDGKTFQDRVKAVSYTHLTLPTICSV